MRRHAVGRAGPGDAGRRLAIVVIVRLVLDPVATHYTRKALNRLRGPPRRLPAGPRDSVSARLRDPAHQDHRASGGRLEAPVVLRRACRRGLDWSELFHARLAAHARLDEPKLIATVAAEEGGAPKAKERAGRARALERCCPARVNRVEVRDGEILYRDLTAPRDPQLWVHGLELAGGEPRDARGAGGGPAGDGERRAPGWAQRRRHAVRLGRTRSQRSWTFAGKCERGGLEGRRAVRSRSSRRPKLQTPKGTIDVFAEFKARRGAYLGRRQAGAEEREGAPDRGQLRQQAEGLGRRQGAAAVLGSRSRAQRGRHGRPDQGSAGRSGHPARGRPCSASFATPSSKGSRPGFTHLPPPASEKKQGVLSQAKEALEKDKGPPKAQPPKADAEAGKK